MMQFLGRYSGKWIGVFAIMYTVFFCSTLWAANIYVAPNGTGDGLSTTSPASLQVALDTAANTAGDHVLYLQQGVYDAFSANGFHINPLANAAARLITISGGWNTDYTSQTPNREATRLDGDNSVRVLDLSTEDAAVAVTYHLHNLTVEKGYATGTGNSGAGVRVHYSGGLPPSLTVTNCLFRNNVTTNSGGAILSNVYFSISNTAFSSNSAGTGGAIYAAYATPLGVSPVIDGCSFDDNRSTSWQGSAIYNGNVDLTVRNSTLTGRSDGTSSSGPGSTIYNHTGSRIFADTCVFRQNIIDYWGSAIQLWDAGGTIQNSVFMGNRAGLLSGYGAVAYYDNSQPAKPVAITNCTFVDNWGNSDSQGALHNRGADLSVTNSIFWNNGNVGAYSEYGTATMSYSLAEGALAYSGFTNGGYVIADNPLLAPGDYHLQEGSPCIDSGSNTAAAGIATDIDGDPRIVNGTVDMGADEHVPAILPLTPSEGTAGTVITINGSGFGNAKGKVLMGTVAPKVITWTDTQITCTVKKVPLPLGPHPVSVTTKGKETTTLPTPFTVKGPELDELAESSGVSGDEIAVTGNFFGIKRGKVYLEYVDSKSQTKKKNCKVTYWYMNPATGASELRFIVPKLSKTFMVGPHPLTIDNKIGVAAASEDFIVGLP